MAHPDISANEAFELAVGRSRVECFEYDGLTLERCNDDLGQLPRGSIRAAGRVLYGYSHIGRVLVLRRGLTEQLAGPFHVEEKINGYNVRIARVEGRLLAFTRGGFVCPFTTDRLPDLLDPAFFDAHPDKVICGEVAGPENPWLDASPPFIERDVRLFVFDIGGWNRPDFLPVCKLRTLLDECALPAVPAFGWSDAGRYAELARQILELNEQGREGLIFRQGSPRPKRVKYVTAQVNLDDIQRSANRMADMPPGYFAGRILRIALFLQEHHLDTQPFEDALGHALLGSLDETLTHLQQEHRASQPFTCRFRKRHNAEQMVALLQRVAGHKVKIVIHGIDAEADGYWRLRFERRYPLTNSLLYELLGGGLIHD